MVRREIIEFLEGLVAEGNQAGMAIMKAVKKEIPEILVDPEEATEEMIDKFNDIVRLNTAEKYLRKELLIRK